MKTLLITGASAGIGLAAAQRFAAAGYAVTNISRRPCPLASVNHLPGDLSEANFLDALSDRLSDALADADQVTLVHNASRLLNDSAADTPSDQLRAVMEVNLAAPNTLNRFLIPRMPPGSSILYVGSTLAEKAVPNSYSYVVTKHALIGMMRATCQDLAGRGHTHRLHLPRLHRHGNAARPCAGGGHGRRARPIRLRPSHRALGNCRHPALGGGKPGHQWRGAARQSRPSGALAGEPASLSRLLGALQAQVGAAASGPAGTPGRYPLPPPAA